MTDAGSPRDSSFFVFNHSVEGFVRFSRRKDRVLVTCHWPFDLDTDEWIDIEGDYAASAYDHGVASFLTNGEAKIEGTYGHLALQDKDSSSFWLELAQTVPPLPRVIQLILDVPRELLLSRS